MPKIIGKCTNTGRTIGSFPAIQKFSEVGPEDSFRGVPPADGLTIAAQPILLHVIYFFHILINYR